MEVILLEQVKGLGVLGDLVEVKSGYARNFLLPYKKALRATKLNKERVEKDFAGLLANSTELKYGAQAIAGVLNGRAFFVVRAAGEMGQLYGSVSARDIAALVSSKIECDVLHSQVSLRVPIKELGVFSVAINLHPEVEVEVFVNVVRSMDELENQELLVEESVDQTSVELEDKEDSS